MNLLIFFTTENKSGYKTKESFIKNNYIILYNEIIEFCKNIENIPFKQKIWHFIHKQNEIPKCKKCEKDLTFKKSLNEGYGKYCSIMCTNSDIEHINNVKSKNNLIYGGNSPIHSDIIKDKIKKSTFTKFGVKNIFEDTSHIKRKIFDKYGVTHMSKLESSKQNRNKTNLKKYGVSTPLLLVENRIKNKEKKLESFNDKYKNLNIINNKGFDIDIICDKCNHNYTINRSLLFYRFGSDLNPCTNCNQVNNLSSIKESELCLFLSENNIEYIKNDRNILNKKEIDIYIPYHNIAIEFNGIYWHSNLFKSKEYHQEKTNMCELKNIQLIQIFEDEWDNKKEIVKSIILNKLKKNNNKIYARKCIIKEVETKDKSLFLDENHIQGKVGSSINVGLYYNDMLVSIMTFGKKRKSLGNKTIINDEYELIRFCNKLNTSIIGGASKLLNYFIKTYNPNEIVSYADRRWSKGDLYQKLGFKRIKNTNPNYFYIINKKRKNRFEFRKDILIKEGFDANKTESQIMDERGILHIYDSGSILFIFKNI
jgi:hypothetical protein